MKDGLEMKDVLADPLQGESFPSSPPSQCTLEKENNNKTGAKPQECRGRIGGRISVFASALGRMSDAADRQGTTQAHRQPERRGTSSET